MPSPISNMKQQLEYLQKSEGKSASDIAVALQTPKCFVLNPFKNAEYRYPATSCNVKSDGSEWHKNGNRSKIKSNRSCFEIKMDAAANTLFGKTRQAVLVLFYEQPTERFYLREIAKITSISSGALQKELAQLHAADLLIRAEDGNRVTYQANTRHPIFSELQSIVAKTCGLPAGIKAALIPFAANIQFAAIYGSLAKGSNHARSDVDLLMVGELTLDKVITLIQPLEELSGREISVRLYARNEFAERKSAGDSFLLGVLSGPLIPLLGHSHDA